MVSHIAEELAHVERRLDLFLDPSTTPEALEAWGAEDDALAGRLARAWQPGGSDVFPSAVPSDVRLAHLAARFALGRLEILVFLFALAPSLDPAVRRKVSSARGRDSQRIDGHQLLELLARNKDDLLALRQLLHADSLLRRYDLVRLVPLGRSDRAGSDDVLSRELAVPDYVVRYLVGDAGLDETLIGTCRLVTRHPSAAADAAPPQDALAAFSCLLSGLEYSNLALQWSDRSARLPPALTVLLSGPPGIGKEFLASMVAARLSRPLFVVDCLHLGALGSGEVLIRAIFGNASLTSSVLFFRDCEAVLAAPSPVWSELRAALGRHDGPVVFATSRPAEVDPRHAPLFLHHVPLRRLDTEARERLWESQLPFALPLGNDIRLTELAATFDLTAGQIRNAVAAAAANAAARAGRDGEVVVAHADLVAGARGQLRSDAAPEGNCVPTHLRFHDLVLPADTREQVLEVLAACRHKSTVLNEWGFRRKLATGMGLCVLFSGDPGTGKTLCAEILAGELGLGLQVVSVPRIMSKWVGETEKNLQDLFSGARASRSVLLFDEADALFTTRVKVETASDRFSNMEVNQLLQEVERFEGIVILTTNLETSMDRAFSRRVQFRVQFPSPGPEERAKIWEKLIPSEAPCQDVDFARLGRDFEISGGYIKNAVLRAAYQARAEGRAIGEAHLMRAAEAECKAAGRLHRAAQPVVGGVSAARNQSLSGR